MEFQIKTLLSVDLKTLRDKLQTVSVWTQLLAELQIIFPKFQKLSNMTEAISKVRTNSIQLPTFPYYLTRVKWSRFNQFKFILKGANKSKYITYGARGLQLELNLNNIFKFTFIIADAEKYILEADFITNLGD